MKTIFDVGISPKIFITVIGSGLVILFISSEILLRYSEKFQKAKDFIESNQEIREKIGDVIGYGLVINANGRSNVNSEMGFVVRGSLSNVKVRVYFKRDSVDN